MAHHQGMSLLALAWTAAGPPDAARFAADPCSRRCATAAGTHPQGFGAVFPHCPNCPAAVHRRGAPEMPIRVFDTPDTPVPEVQLLSNGRYHVMVTNAGRRLQPLERPGRDALAGRPTCATPGAASATSATWKRRSFWSTAHQPTLTPAPNTTRRSSPKGAPSSAVAMPASVAKDGGDFDTHTEIVVSPEDDIELRRVRITNRSPQRREIEITSYAEVVIATSGRRRAASGLQQSVRADRDRCRIARPSCAPAGRAPRRARRPGCCT
jgi:cyclic beta-1,2-glucan synthetase